MILHEPLACRLTRYRPPRSRLTAGSTDIGLVNNRPYLNVASVGIASKVAKVQSKKLKRRWRVLAYAIGLMRRCAHTSSSNSTSTATRSGRVQSIK